MALKILLDMNLSPIWVDFFLSHGIESKHWSSVGSFNAKDLTIFNWARENGYILFTNDLDFGAILAANKENLPSVIQVRTQKVLPTLIGDLVLSSLKEYNKLLTDGALITINEQKMRARILPLK